MRVIQQIFCACHLLLVRRCNIISHYQAFLGVYIRDLFFVVPVIRLHLVDSLFIFITNCISFIALSGVPVMHYTLPTWSKLRKQYISKAQQSHVYQRDKKRRAVQKSHYNHIVESTNQNQNYQSKIMATSPLKTSRNASYSLSFADQTHIRRILVI